MDTKIFPEKVFLISRIQIDPWENQSAYALSYVPYGISYSESAAKAICDSGMTFTRKDCWAIMGELPEFKYKEIGVIA